MAVPTTEADTATVAADQPAVDDNVIEGTTKVVEELLKISPNGDIRARGDKPVVLDFNATWCPPCIEFGPIFHKVAAAMADKAVFVSVDVDQVPRVKDDFGLSAIPQVSIVFPNGVVDSHVGFMTEVEFRRVLDESFAQE